MQGRQVALAWLADGVYCQIMATTKTCCISPIDGTCATHPDSDCNQRPLTPAPAKFAESNTRLWDLPIFGWAWREDGRDRKA